MFDEEFFKMYNEGMDEGSSSPSSETTPSEAIETVSFGDSSKTFVLSIGGSLIAPEKPDATFVSKLSESIDRLYSEGYRFVIVAGGGQTARNYIAAAKVLGADNYSLDKIGIRATRLNASVLIQALERAYPNVLTKIEKSREIIALGKIPVYGGLIPGFTTDAVAALIAEFLKAEYVNITNVDGVYSSDPSINPNAKFYPEISFDRLLSLMKLAETKPGQNLVIDVPACLILKRSRIPGMVLNGSDLNNFENALKGMDFKGTRIVEAESES